MRFSDIIRFYSDPNVKEKIIASAKQREVVARYKDSMGTRPDALAYPEDIVQLIKKGATSFHGSIERWANPLMLAQNMSRKELNELRVGWDFIIDIDCKHFAYSKICAELLCDAIEFHSINNYSLKFSGGTGFHIGIPFESFPKEINKKQTESLFPEASRTIAEYLKQMIKEHLADRILEFESIKEVSKRTGLGFDTLVKDGVFDPYKVLTIDTVAMSQRHLIRMPYSFNEKAWLVSVPITKEDLPGFKLEHAKYENVKPELGFLDKSKEDEAKQLFLQAFDWEMKEQVKKEISTLRKEYDIPQEAIRPEHFPPCIRHIYTGVEDGRKRSVFILINFLKSAGWDNKQVEDEVLNVNKSYKDPLPENYVRSQLNWSNRQKDKYLTPSCKNENYMPDIGICTPDWICKYIKNPAAYPFKKIQLLKKRKKDDKPDILRRAKKDSDSGKRK